MVMAATAEVTVKKTRRQRRGRMSCGASRRPKRKPWRLHWVFLLEHDLEEQEEQKEQEEQ